MLVLPFFIDVAPSNSTTTSINQKYTCPQAIYSTYKPNTNNVSANIDFCQNQKKIYSSESKYEEGNDTYNIISIQTTISTQALVENKQIALRNFENKKLAIKAAKQAFDINIENDTSILAKNILCITNAMRNITVQKLKIIQPDSETLEFYYAIGGRRVIQISSSFPRKTNENVIVSLYADGDCVYMNDMPLKELINDLEEYL